MRGIFNAIKVAALYVGTVIGAGFATGRELCLYFAKSDIFTIIVSALLMGVFCFIFLYLGKTGIKSNPTIKKIINVTLAISAFFVYAAMLAAAEEIVSTYFYIPLAGILMGILSAFCSNSLEKLKKVNIILIPLLICTVIFIASKAEVMPLSSGFRPLNALAYCTMNMLFASSIMYGAGKDMKKTEIILSSSIVVAVMFALMYYMLRVVIAYQDFSMPFLLVATKSNFGVIGVVTILIAIFTTVTSCNKIVVDELTQITRKGYMSALITFGLGIMVSICGFKQIVNLTYPIISGLGIAVCAFAFFELIGGAKKRLKGDSCL